MNRYDFYNTNTINKLMYVYNLYKMMEDKHKESISNDEYYNLMFFNYKKLNLDICMRGDGFYVYEMDADPDDKPIFTISSIEDYNIDFYESKVSDDYFCFRGGREFIIIVGDSPDYKTSRVIADSYMDTEEILSEKTEEWFFQQMTVQNIIEYEQLKKELNFCYEFYNRLNDSNIVIEISDLSTFNIEILNGFRVI